MLHSMHIRLITNVQADHFKFSAACVQQLQKPNANSNMADHDKYYECMADSMWTCATVEHKVNYIINVCFIRKF